jgi:hypothetical protein
MTARATITTTATAMATQIATRLVFTVAICLTSTRVVTPVRADDAGTPARPEKDPSAMSISPFVVRRQGEGV